jgi:hypothetical protein
VGNSIAHSTSTDNGNVLHDFGLRVRKYGFEFKSHLLGEKTWREGLLVLV